MVPLTFLKDPLWDFPFFKQLARNDTGAAPGHQAGMVVPHELRPFFPNLTGEPTREQPTIEHNITAFLLVDGHPVETVTTRYQIQSWGGTRAPETRLTGNLGPLRNKAREDDFLVIQRSLTDLDVYRLSLIRQGTPDYGPFSALARDRRWGVVADDIPVTQTDMDDSERELSTTGSRPFEMFQRDISLRETKSRRVARSLIFRLTVQKLYGQLCCACGTGLRSLSGGTDIDAAHIIPKRCLGSDDPRNGLALCKRHHWALDNGLFGIDQERRILVASPIRRIPQNKILARLNGNPLREANDPKFRADQAALCWHRENILIT